MRDNTTTFGALPMHASFRFVETKLVNIPRFSSGPERTLANLDGVWIKTCRGDVRDATQAESDKNARCYFHPSPSLRVVREIGAWEKASTLIHGKT